jgi:hypothetical protein
MRPRLVLAASLMSVAGIVVALTSIGGTGAAQSIARPTTSLSNVKLDYALPALDSDGTTTTISPLMGSVVNAALADYNELHYLKRGDLGGFEPAPVGEYYTVLSGRALASSAVTPQIPLFAKAGTDLNQQVTSFAFTSGVSEPLPPFSPNLSPQTTQPAVPGSSVPTVYFKGTIPTTTTTTTPPSGGTSTSTTPAASTATTPGRRSSTSTSTTPRPSSTTTTTVPTSTHSTTTTATTTHSTTTTTSPTHTTTTTPSTTTTTTPSTTTTTTTPPNCGASASNTVSMSNDEDCQAIITARNMAPGGSSSGQVTIKNTGSTSYTLVLQINESDNSPLERYLTLTVTNASTGAQYYQGVDGSYANAEIPIVTDFAPGASTRFDVTLMLSSSADNSVQNHTATIDLDWGTDS